jgi:hypothetical protein
VLSVGPDKFLATFAELQRANVSFVMSVCPSVHPSSWKNSAATGMSSIKFDTLRIFRKSVENIPVALKSDKNNGSLA